MTRSSLIFLGLVLVGLLCQSTVGSPVSFPDSTKDHAEEAPITPPPSVPVEDTDEGEDPTVAEIVNQVPQILGQIQNYINSAVSAYAPNANATSAASPASTDDIENTENSGLNQQIIGVVNGFLSLTNNIAQQLLQADPQDNLPNPAPPVVPEQSNTVE